MTELLFSYGTLQLEKIQMELFGRKLKGSKDALKGYRADVIEITDEAFLARGDGQFQRIATRTGNPIDSIEGMAFELTTEELEHADKYEPPDYKRVQIELASGNKAWIYMAR